MLQPKTNGALSRSILVGALLFMLSTGARPPAEDGQDREQRRGPPSEALEACASLTEGASCGFRGRRGDVNGTCIVPRDRDEVLACAPSNHRRRDTDEPDNSRERGSLSGVAQPAGNTGHGYA